jgi:deoxyribodipyrimidine photolyase-related protein
MENFYRYMRVKHNIFMQGDKPIGGKWNYDKDNRKFPKEVANLSSPKTFSPDAITDEVLELVDVTFSDHFGDLYPFNLAVTRKQALASLNHFIKERLSRFGDYQDAMIENEPYLYHSFLSFYINTGLLLPREVIKKVETAYQAHDIPINAAEGFIRQILGWREYIRGIYWHKMPQYAESNYFNANKPLPDLFWTGDTKLNCLSQCVNETQQNAYAHHIQRLMVLGNFLLLLGVDPEQVNEWYLIVYADAFEWVELPNVTGMILYADGGYLASKPYAAGGAYINRMSNYCKSCHYNVKEKTGDQACPFNYLYWNFLDQHQDKLSKNQRLAMVYSTLRKMDAEHLATIRSNAKSFIDNL